MTLRAQERGLDFLDMALVVIYLLGIYTGYTIQISANIPFPSAPSGLAGMVLLWRRRDRIQASHIGAFFIVLLVYLASICAATNLSFLHKRFTGLIQITYSFVIAYAFFMTLIEARRRQIAALFLTFSVVIFVGCMLEDYGGLRPISDAVRLKLYSSGIYDADLRDELLYGRIRPKLFTSEPSAVTFAYTLFTFAWLATSRSRWKLPIYFALMGGGMFAMPGPTLLLMVLLLIPYGIALAKPRRWTALHLVAILVGSCALVGLFFILSNSVYSARLNEIYNGDDPSFFYRVQGPALVAADVIRDYPLAGAGLTGEHFISNKIIDTFVRSPDFSTAWQFTNLDETLTNYVWLHWIYLGLFFGTVSLVALTVWLRVLGVPSPSFCWLVWIVLGQASGAYVGPKTWTVLFLSGACAVLHRRPEPIPARAAAAPAPRWQPALHPHRQIERGIAWR